LNKSIDIDKCLVSISDKTIDRIDAILSIPQDRIVRGNFARDIELDLSNRENEFKEKMFPLNIVFDRTETLKWRRGYNEYYKNASDIVEKWDKFETEVIDTIFTYKLPVIKLNRETPKEAVCQVFENVNTGGVSLTVFELVTATFAMDDFDLRKDWETRHREMTKKDGLLSVVSNVDFMVASTLLSRYHAYKNGGAAVSCKKQDVLNLSKDDYEKHADNLTEGFIQAANFLREQRIFSKRDLPYTTQFIPFSVLLAILKQRAQDAPVRDKLSKWFWCGVFGEMYGSANETRFANDVTGLMGWLNGGSEPDTMARAYFQSDRLLSLQSRNSAAYKGLMAVILESGARDFISGKEMDFTIFSNAKIDIHHIFPKAYCKAKFSKDKWNSVVNKTPLSSRTNRIIGGNAPSVYLKKLEKNGHVTETVLDNFVETHHIDATDLHSDRFDDYFLKRAKALLKLIDESMGKPVRNLDGDDVVKVFGTSLK
jgi:hypothetical protein